MRNYSTGGSVAEQNIEAQFICLGLATALHSKFTHPYHALEKPCNSATDM